MYYYMFLLLLFLLCIVSTIYCFYYYCFFYALFLLFIVSTIVVFTIYCFYYLLFLQLLFLLLIIIVAPQVSRDHRSFTVNNDETRRQRFLSDPPPGRSNLFGFKIIADRLFRKKLLRDQHHDNNHYISLSFSLPPIFQILIYLLLALLFALLFALLLALLLASWRLGVLASSRVKLFIIDIDKSV